jgi:uncharacterized RmlC-like cupin family protein
METIQETNLIYGHYNPNANWHFVEWEKRKYTAFNRHFYSTIGGDVEDPNALTVFMADEKGGILQQQSYNWDLHNGDEVVIQVGDGAMHWWSGPIERRGTNPNEILGHEKLWNGNFGDVVNLPAGTPHTQWPKTMLPEDSRLFVIYNPARGSSYPMPDVLEESHWIHPTTYSFGEIGYIKYFDYKVWRVTFFDFKKGFLPKEPKAIAKFDFDTYIFFVDGKFEFWFDPNNIIEKISAYAWDGMCVPAGLPFYGKDLGDVRGVILTNHAEKPDNKPEIEDWKKILLGA